MLVLNNICWSQKKCVNCCMIPRTKSESMVRFWSWLKRISTRGIMQWNSFRKKLKVSLSSSLTNYPAFCTEVGSNSYDGVKTLDDVTFVLKHSVHSMDIEVPSYWESVCHYFIKQTGSLGKSLSEKNWLTDGMWDVTCCLMKVEEEEIAAYGGVGVVLVPLGLQQPKVWNNLK